MTRKSQLKNFENRPRSPTQVSDPAAKFNLSDSDLSNPCSDPLRTSNVLTYSGKYNLILRRETVGKSAGLTDVCVLDQNLPGDKKELIGKSTSCTMKHYSHF